MNRGFTLVEIMVSLTIFSIVMVISVGTTLVMIDMNAKAQELYTANTNLSFAIDSMTRDIRTGQRIYCGPVVNNVTQTADNYRPNGFDNLDGDECSAGKYIAFTRQTDGLRVGYRFNPGNNKLEFAADDGSLKWVPLTSDQVTIDTTNSYFRVVKPYRYGITDEGTGQFAAVPGGEDRQVNMDVFIAGTVNNGLETNTEFSVQSHIVPRKLDI